MKKLLLVLLTILCDNIEIATKDFDKLIVKDQILYSADIKKCNYVKISHIGTSVYYLEEKEPRTFVLKDKTVYFDLKKQPAAVRIDLEYKKFGLATFVWKFLLFVILFTFASSVIVHKGVVTLLKTINVKQIQKFE